MGPQSRTTSAFEEEVSLAEAGRATLALLLLEIRDPVDSFWSVDSPSASVNTKLTRTEARVSSRLNDIKNGRILRRQIS